MYVCLLQARPRFHDILEILTNRGTVWQRRGQWVLMAVRGRKYFIRPNTTQAHRISVHSSQLFSCRVRVRVRVRVYVGRGRGGWRGHFL